MIDAGNSSIKPVSSRHSDLSGTSTPLLRKSEHSVLRSNEFEQVGASKWGASITTFKSIIGGGFIALPYALQQAGMFAGILVILAVWLCTSITTKQLVECSKKVKEHDPSVSLEDVDYGKLGEAAYDKWGNYLSVAPLLGTQFIAGCAYIVFISTTLANVVSADGSDSAHKWIAFAVVLIECVIAMAPNPSFLVGTANFGCFAFLFAIIFTFFTAATENPPSLENTVPFQTFAGMYICFGICVFTFSAHAEAVSIYATAALEARSAYLMIIDTVLLVVAILYVTFAIFSYMCFGDATSSIIFENLGMGVGNSFVKLCISAMLLCNYPLTVYPVHQSLEIMLGLNKVNEEPSDLEVQRRSGERLPLMEKGEISTRLNWKQAVSRLLIVVSTGLIAVFVGDAFGFISAIGGGLNGIIAFVLPPVIHIKLHGGWSNLSWYMLVMNAFLILLGFIGGGGSVYQGVQGILQS